MGQGVALWMAGWGLSSVSGHKRALSAGQLIHRPAPHPPTPAVLVTRWGLRVCALHFLSERLSVQACKSFMCLREGLDQPIDVQSKLSALP